MNSEEKKKKTNFAFFPLVKPFVNKKKVKRQMRISKRSNEGF